MPDETDAHFYDDLDATLEQAWSLLARGAADRRSGFHTVQLATLAQDGPRLRTVVLRGAEASARRVRMHTDIRSHKVAEIEVDPRVELCAYDSRAKIQLRLRGRAAIHRDDPLADAAWAGSGDGSRRCYRAPVAPGAELALPHEGDLPETALAPADRDAGRAAFAAVALTVSRIEWLYLASRGHRRAAFDWDGADWSGRWLAP